MAYPTLLNYRYIEKPDLPALVIKIIKPQGSTVKFIDENGNKIAVTEVDEKSDIFRFSSPKFKEINIDLVPISTVTVTPIIYVTAIATPVTPIMTETPQEVQNGKVAILQVVYNLGRKDNGAEVTVTLKNVGSSTARFVNLSMNIPVGLDAILDSGAEMDGNTIVWTGDIEPGKEHIIKYQVGAPKADIEIPVKVTYIDY